MTSKFDLYDLLGTIVPGTLLLGWTAACFPEQVQGVSQIEFLEAFTVIVLTALAVFVGQLVQAVASLVEPAIYKSWGGRPSDIALEKGLKGFLPSDSAKRIRSKLHDTVGSSAETHSLFLYSMQLSDGQDVGRARRFNTLYAYHRALLVLVVVCGVMLGAAMIWGQAAAWSVGEKLQAQAKKSLFFLLTRDNRREFFFVPFQITQTPQVATFSVYHRVCNLTFQCCQTTAEKVTIIGAICRMQNCGQDWAHCMPDESRGRQALRAIWPHAVVQRQRPQSQHL